MSAGSRAVDGGEAANGDGAAGAAHALPPALPFALCRLELHAGCAPCAHVSAASRRAAGSHARRTGARRIRQCRPQRCVRACVLTPRLAAAPADAA